MVTPVFLMTGAKTAPSIPALFRAKGATEPGQAMAWTPPDKMQAVLFRRLVERGALVEMKPGTWYLNEEKLATGRGGQVAVAVALGAALLLAGTFLLLWS